VIVMTPTIVAHQSLGDSATVHTLATHLTSAPPFVLLVLFVLFVLQALYFTGAPILVNLTVLNGISVSGTFVDGPTYRPASEAMVCVCVCVHCVC